MAVRHCQKANTRTNQATSVSVAMTEVVMTIMALQKFIIIIIIIIIIITKFKLTNLI